MTKEGTDMKKWRKRSKQGRNAFKPSPSQNIKRRVHPGEADLQKTLEDANRDRAQACSRDYSQSPKVHQRRVKNLPMFSQKAVKTKMKSSAILVVSDHLEFEEKCHFSV